MLSYLNYDCAFQIASKLDYRSILSLTQVSHFYSLVCNDDRVWRCKLYERIGRDIDGGKLMFRKALRAGEVKVFSFSGCEHELLSSFDRRDIVKVSAHMQYLACITLDSRCLVSGPFQEQVELIDIGQADDALVMHYHYSSPYWLVAFIYNGKLQVLQYNGDDLQNPLEIPVLRNKRIKSLLSIDNVVEDDWNIIPYITCLLEDDRVMYAACRSPSRMRKIKATKVSDCFVFGKGELSWTCAPGTKYIHCPPGTLFSLGMRIYLSNKKMSYVVYDKDEGWKLTDGGKRFPSHYYDTRTVYQASHGYMDNVDDVCITDEGDIVVLSEGNLLCKPAEEEEWKLMCEHVLWIRSNCMLKNWMNWIACIVEPDKW